MKPVRRNSAPYRAGLVGCGRVGFMLERDPLRVKPCTHAGGIASHPDFRLVAGCDLDPARLADFGRTYDIPPDHLYTRVEDMLARERLDFLSIATWTESHDRIVGMACRANVGAITCEKPMAVTYPRARAMVSAARRSKTLLLINHGRRWMSEYRTVRRCIREKWYGELRHIQGCVLTPFDAQASRRRRDWHSEIASSGGGPLLHDGTHLIDIVFFLTGRRPAVVEGKIERSGRSAVERRAWGRLAFRGRPPLDFCFEAGGTRRYFHFEIELWFEGGRILVGNGLRRAEKAVTSRQYSGFEDLTADPDFAWEKSAGSVERVGMGEVARWFSDSIPPENTAAESLLSQETIFAAYESAVRGREISFPYRPRRGHPFFLAAR